MNDTLWILVVAVGVTSCLGVRPKTAGDRMVPAPPMPQRAAKTMVGSRSVIIADRLVPTADSGVGLARKPVTLVLEGPVRRLYSSTNLVDWKLEAGGDWDRVIIYEVPTESRKFYRHD